MIKYANAREVLIRKIKKVRSCIVCDRCGKEISCLDPRGLYYQVTIGHDDWGAESCESIEKFDICPECIAGFTEQYLKDNDDSDTAYINILTAIAWPKEEYSEVEVRI